MIDSSLIYILSSGIYIYIRRIGCPYYNTGYPYSDIGSEFRHG